MFAFFYNFVIMILIRVEVDMKKIVVLICLLLCGCSSKYVTCTSETNNSTQGYHSKISYKIYYKNEKVTKTIIKGEYTSDVSDLASYFNTYLKTNYEYLNNTYSGYEFSKEKIDNGVKYNVVIDYSKVDLAKMIEDNEIDKNYVKNDNLTLSGALEMYEKLGATCTD